MRINFVVATLLSICTALAVTGQSSQAQGIGEYGGVLSTPKAVPRVPSKTLNKVFGAPGKALSGATRGKSSTSGSSSKANQTTRVSSGTAGDALSRTITKQQVYKLRAKAQKMLHEAIKADKAGKAAEAEKLYKQSLVIRQTYWRGRDPWIPKISLALADIYSSQDKFADAERSLKSALASFSRQNGPGGKETAAPLKMLGDICLRRGEFENSHDYYKKAYTLFGRFMGENSRETLDVGVCLAAANTRLEDYRDAVSVYEDVFESDASEKILGPHRAASALKDYANALRRLGRKDEAKKIDSRARALTEKAESETTEPTEAPSKPDTN